MKSSEIRKTTGKTKKITTNKKTATKRITATSVKTVRTRKVTAKKAEPTEEEVRKKALEIYYERISRGEHGTPEEDWFKAVEALKK